MRALSNGLLDKANDLIERTARAGRRMRLDTAEAVSTVQASVHRWLAGSDREIVPLARRSVEVCPWLSVHRAALAFALVELGRKTEASAELERLAQDGFAAVPNDGNWLLSTTLLAHTAAGLGDRRRAMTLHQMLVPYADRFSVSGDATVAFGPVATALGVTASTAGRHDEALVFFERTLTGHDSSDPASIMTKREYARTLLARQAPGDAGPEALHAFGRVQREVIVLARPQMAAAAHDPYGL